MNITAILIYAGLLVGAAWLLHGLFSSWYDFWHPKNTRRSDPNA